MVRAILGGAVLGLWQWLVVPDASPLAVVVLAFGVILIAEAFGRD